MFKKIIRFLCPGIAMREAIDRHDEKMRAYYKSEIADIFAGTHKPGKRPKPVLRV